MKLLKRLSIIVLSFLLIIAIGVAILPLFFKDKITAVAKREINNAINAKADFADVSLSFIKNFPNLRLGLKDFTLEGIDEFEGISLAKVSSFDLVLDLFSIMSGQDAIQLKSIHLEKPDLQIIVLKDGTANYNIAKSSDQESASTTSGSADFNIALNRYSIKDASLIYHDKSTNTFVNIEDLDHEGSGRFTLSNYDLDTKSDLNGFTVRQGGITYLDEAQAHLDAVLNIDQSTNTYTLKDNALKINDLIINTDGYVQLLPEDQIEMKLKVNTPQNNFKNLLSMVPNAYIEGYEAVKATGQFMLQALVNGTYDAANNKYPTFQIGLQVENGNVQYPDLPLGVSDIHTDIFVNSPSSSLNNMLIDAQTLRLKVGNNPIAGRFKLTHILTDPNAEGQIKGVLNLADLARAYPIEGMKEMSGIIDADVDFLTSMSAIEKEQYDAVIMQGAIKGKDIVYHSEEYPKISVKEVESRFTPESLVIGNFSSQLGKSDLTASGNIDNFLAYFAPDKTMKGSLKVRSSLFDANEWYQPSQAYESAAIAAEISEEHETIPTKIFDRFDFTIDAELDNILFETYEIKDNVVRGQITPNSLKVDYLSGKIKDTDYSAAGVINDVFDYLFEDGVLTGAVTVNSSYVNLNQFMVSTGASEEAASGSGSEYTIDAILVPPDINVSMDANVGRVLYDKIELSNISGNMLVENRTVVLNDVKANGLGGDIRMSGTYDTKDRNQPSFNIKYDMQQLDFQKSFNALNTFQTIAPVARFINGTFSSSLIMDGVIGKDLMPDFASLNAKGFLETINGIVDGFKPLQVIGNSLDIQELKNKVVIAKTKNWVEIKDGSIELKEFDYNVEDIAMKISGKHSISQEIDYMVKASVPRSKLGNGAVGNAAAQGIGLLQEQAQKLGVSINNAEIINLGIQLTGSITDPKIKVNFLGADGETTIAQAAKDELKKQVDERVAEQKEVLNAKKEEVKDSVKAVADQKVEAAKEEAKQKAKDILKDKVGTPLGTAIDSTVLGGAIDTATASKVDDIKKELEKFNPFKKKKKKN